MMEKECSVSHAVSLLDTKNLRCFVLQKICHCANDKDKLAP
jgi:hypothetical protein